MERYPLSWPTGWPRTTSQGRMRARFTKGERKYSSEPNGGSWISNRSLTVADGVKRALEALRMLGVEEGDAIISTNIKVRLDGLPYSWHAEPNDPGVSIYWRRPGEDARCMAIDRYDRVADNLAAIAATLEAMRAIERHGGAQILDRAFTGFTALPAPKEWWDVLQVRRDSSIDVVKANYRRLAADHHPDRGGSSERMAEINRAWDEAQRALS